ncbi:MAG: lasso peptide biosynthesis B2 protein [Alphaproteobacteria bacterium]|jgi:hypothetical protein|nr:lasso peptide biosynthesis B2 protein [Alphaproteobacteria bacterium]
MYYHLNEHIYVAQFREELILLDTRADKYTICNKTLCDLLIKILKTTNPPLMKHLLSSNVSQSSSIEATYIQKLLDNKIIEKKETPFPYYIDRKKDSLGVANVDWRLPLGNKKSKLYMQVLIALISLIKINIYMKIKGFYSTIELIKKSRKSETYYIIPKPEDLRNLANIVNDACLIYPTRTKCLEWAMTFVLMALKRKWKCNLEIGLQNYPFMAHAWVECDGKVVMDSPELRDGLAIILNEPFRRFNI